MARLVGRDRAHLGAQNDVDKDVGVVVDEELVLVGLHRVLDDDARDLLAREVVDRGKDDAQARDDAQNLDARAVNEKKERKI